jgi:hypothetical protein
MRNSLFFVYKSLSTTFYPDLNNIGVEYFFGVVTTVYSDWYHICYFGNNHIYQFLRVEGETLTYDELSDYQKSIVTLWELNNILPEWSHRL